MLKTERACKANVKSRNPVEVVTTSSSPIIFNSQPLQPKNRKRDFQEDEEGPVPKILRTIVDESQEKAAVNENIINTPKPSLIDVSNSFLKKNQFQLITL